MVHVLEIWDRDKAGYLLPDLKNILALLSENAHELCWAIQEIEAVGNLTPMGFTISDLVKAIQKSDRGYFIEWKALVQMAGYIKQTTNLVLVACRSWEAVPPMSLSEGGLFLSSFEFLIKCNDSTFWEIASREDNLLASFLTAYHDIRRREIPSH